MILSFFAIHPDADLAVIADVLDGAEVTVGNLQILGRSCELYFVSNGELALDLTIRCDAAQAGWVISHLLAVLLLHGNKVLLRVRGYDLGITSWLDAMFFASTGVMQDISPVIATGPLSVCAGHIVSRRQHAHGMIGFVHDQAPATPAAPPD